MSSTKSTQESNPPQMIDIWNSAQNLIYLSSDFVEFYAISSFKLFVQEFSEIKAEVEREI